MRPVRGGTMLGVGHGDVRLAGSHMRGDALALMEDLNGGGGSAHLHGLTRELIGHTVEAAVELDVIVDVQPLDSGTRRNSAAPAA